MSKLFPLLFFLLFFQQIFAQDFSNKGKEFWLVFPAHVQSSEQAKMGLFITSDKNSSGVIKVNGFSVAFTVIANQVTGPINIPYGVANVGTTNTVVNKGIHVTVTDGQPPVVLYAHIYAGFRSEASLILPVNTLGKKYYSTNFRQLSTDGSQSQFNVVAVEANTVIQYQLRTNGALSPIVTTISLPNPGDQIQVQNGSDLSGSIIESVASGLTTCKKIAVFSGSSAIAIHSSACTNPDPDSFDPLYQQCYPVSSWGKNFGIVPFANNSNGFHLRVIASENNTIINFNGTPVTLNAGQFYPASNPAPAAFLSPMTISSDKPISVSQYMMSSACAGATDIRGQTNQQGDPDMIILNPVEQNISDINIFSSSLQNIHTKFLNVYIKTSAAASFRINNALPIKPFVPMPQNNGYSYLQEALTNYPTSTFRLQADSGFNAISYGMGDAESYGYSAGTNVKDLYQQVGVSTKYGIETTPSVCIGSPFKYKVSLPYQPDSMYWDLTPLYPGVWIKPVFPSTTLSFDSSTYINGKQVWWYSLPTAYDYTSVGSYPIKIQVYKAASDGCGNQQEIDFDLEVSAEPIPSFTASNPNCVAETVAFSESTNSSKPIYKWWWNFSDPGSGAANISTLQNPSHLFSAPGTYKVRYANISTVGCLSDTISRDIIVAPLPSASIAIAGANVVCQNGTSPSVVFTGSGGSGGYSFKYNINGGPTLTAITTTGNTVSIPVSTSTAGNYVFNLLSVQYTGSALCTRPETAAVTIKVLSLPAASVSGTSSACQNSNSANVIFTGVNGILPYTFIYNINGGANISITTTGTNNSVTIVPPTGITGTFVYKLVGVTDGSPPHCIGSVSAVPATITVRALPTASISGNAEVCLNSPVPQVTFTGLNGLLSYRFSYRIGNDPTLYTVASPGSSNMAHVSVPTSIAGTFIYHLVSITDGGGSGCSQNQSGTATIIVNPIPSAGFSFNLPSCQGSEVNFNSNLSLANAGVINSWQWSFGDPSSAALNESISPNPSHLFSTSGTFTVTLKVGTDKGCVSAVYTKTITINSRPKAGFVVPEVCLQDPFAQFNDTSAILSPASLNSWEWNFGDGNSTPGNPNTSLNQSPTHRYTSVGNYTVRLIVISNAGCRDTVSHQLFINAGNPMAAFSVLNATSICSGDSIVIQNKSFVASGNITRLEIFWDNVSAPTISEADELPAMDKIYKHKYPSFQSPPNKTFNVRLRAYSGTTCFNDLSVPVIVNASPKVKFESLPNACLDQAPYRITQASETSGLSGSGVYSGPGVTIDGPGLFNFTASLAGKGLHTIKYIFSTTAGCKDSTTQTVNVYSNPLVNAGTDGAILAGGSILLNPTVSGDDLSYLWLENKYLNNNHIKAPLASPLEDITYKLTVTGRGGCTSSDDVFIKVLPAPKIPNTFSPNNDGINDFWQISYLDSYPDNRVQVFTRTGTLVFESRGYKKPWDGNSNGKSLPVDTYYYIIEPGSGRRPITGYVTIIK